MWFSLQFIYNLGIISTTRTLIGSQTSLLLSEILGSEESQVNYVLPFSSEDEIDTPSLFTLFAVNNNLYITAIKNTDKNIYKKNLIYSTLRICFACSSHLSMHFTTLFSVEDKLSYETFLSAVYFGVLTWRRWSILYFFFFSTRRHIWRLTHESKTLGRC